MQRQLSYADSPYLSSVVFRGTLYHLQYYYDQVANLKKSIVLKCFKLIDIIVMFRLQFSIKRA